MNNLNEWVEKGIRRRRWQRGEVDIIDVEIKLKEFKK